MYKLLGPDLSPFRKVWEELNENHVTRRATPCSSMASFEEETRAKLQAKRRKRLSSQVLLAFIVADYVKPTLVKSALRGTV